MSATSATSATSAKPAIASSYTSVERDIMAFPVMLLLVVVLA
jgi:hypothetical protein